MKINQLLIIFVIIGCILVAGYFARSVANPGVSNLTSNATDLAENESLSGSANSTDISPKTGTGFGQVIISIGQYNSQLPVTADGIKSGNVSNGKPLALNLTEGSHLIRVCTATVCESVEADIKSTIKTTIELEERLDNDNPQGSLSISIGDYPANLPAFVDGTKVGIISPGKLFNQTLSVGNHTVKICLNTTCINEKVEIQPQMQTSLDFEERLEKDVSQGSIRVSIGGYNTKLRVSLDNMTVGVVSMGTPLDLKINEGNHTVRVCVGKVCEQEDVQVKFAKLSVVDFEARLKKDVEFPTPTIQIIQSSMSGTTMTVDVEFINPDNKDHLMAATVSCVYSFTDSTNMRKNNAVQTRVSQSVKAGTRITVQSLLSLSGGPNVIANVPVITGITIT